MAFGGFKETNESNEVNENNESSLDNTEKPRNQILETPDDYDDDFDSKLDSNEANEGEDGDESSEGDDAGGEKQRFFDKIKGFFSKEKNDTDENTESENEPQKSRAESFRDSLKETRSPEEVKQYNEEHGYPDVSTERPKGGFERERGGDDPRWEDSNEDSDNTENN